MSVRSRTLTSNNHPVTCAIQKGFTLIELVIGIVVILIVVSGLFAALTSMGGSSGDPLPRSQAIALAESYLEEIRLQQYAPLSSCPAVPPPGGRARFTHICHYQGVVDNGARDQFDNAIGGLEDYQVSVAISQTGQLGSIASVDTQLISVTVTSPANETLTLSTYRARELP